MWSPPMCTERSGLRGWRSHSRGALATCSRTNSGSSLTRFSPSTVCPALRKYSTASGSMNSIPSSVTMRRQPRSRTSIASSLRISYRGIEFTNMRSSVVDAWDGVRNISAVEQEFQPAATATPGTLAIDRAAQLLTLVLEAERPRALGELAGDLELPKSTASRLLGALERQGLVEQRGARGRFVPGPVLIRFAHRGVADRHLAELAEPHLRILADASEETINLAVPGALCGEHIAQFEC